RPQALGVDDYMPRCLRQRNGDEGEIRAFHPVAEADVGDEGAHHRRESRADEHANPRRQPVGSEQPRGRVRADAQKQRMAQRVLAREAAQNVPGAGQVGEQQNADHETQLVAAHHSGQCQRPGEGDDADDPRAPLARRARRRIRRQGDAGTRSARGRFHPFTFHRSTLPNKPWGRSSTMRTNSPKVTTRAKEPGISADPTDSTKPMTSPPSTAPTILPSPPSTTTTKANSPSSKPTV